MNELIDNMVERQIEEKNLCNFKLFNIPKETFDKFDRKIVRRYSGRNSFAIAFDEMVERYFMQEQFGMLLAELEELKERVEKLEATEKKEIIRTFGGNEVRV